MNVKQISKVFFATTQLNSTQSWVILIFLCKNQTTTKTVSHFISAPTQPNSTKFSMQPYFNPTRRFMPKKLGQPPPPQKKKKKKKIRGNGTSPPDLAPSLMCKNAPNAFCHIFVKCSVTVIQIFLFREYPRSGSKAMRVERKKKVSDSNGQYTVHLCLNQKHGGRGGHVYSFTPSICGCTQYYINVKICYFQTY